MLPLLDTVIGFVAIMLVLSMLVKSLTSLIKNHVDFYSRNLKHEVDRLALAVLGKTWDQAVKDLETDPKTRQEAAWFRGINWERLGDEFLTKDHMEWILKRLGAPAEALDHLEERLQVQVAKLSYAFSTRMKNLAVVIGLALCLGLDINSFAIWRALYADQQLRTTFATTYAQTALQGAGKTGSPEQKGTVASTGSDEERAKLNTETRDFMNKLASFQKDVAFGAGRIWSWKAWEQEKEKAAQEKVAFGRLRKLEFAAVEFLGSLMTGVMISIGAAYWHDLLRELTSFRQS
jgi:hypothetical protein